MNRLTNLKMLRAGIEFAKNNINEITETNAFNYLMFINHAEKNSIKATNELKNKVVDLAINDFKSVVIELNNSRLLTTYAVSIAELSKSSYIFRKLVENSSFISDLQSNKLFPKVEILKIILHSDVTDLGLSMAEVLKNSLINIVNLNSFGLKCQVFNLICYLQAKFRFKEFNEIIALKCEEISKQSSDYDLKTILTVLEGVIAVKSNSNFMSKELYNVYEEALQIVNATIEHKEEDLSSKFLFDIVKLLEPSYKFNTTTNKMIENILQDLIKKTIIEFESYQTNKSQSSVKPKMPNLFKSPEAEKLENLNTVFNLAFKTGFSDKKVLIDLFNNAFKVVLNDKYLLLRLNIKQTGIYRVLNFKESAETINKIREAKKNIIINETNENFYSKFLNIVGYLEISSIKEDSKLKKTLGAENDKAESSETVNNNESTSIPEDLAFLIPHLEKVCNIFITQSLNRRGNFKLLFDGVFENRLVPTSIKQHVLTKISENLPKEGKLNAHCFSAYALLKANGKYNQDLVLDENSSKQNELIDYIWTLLESSKISRVRLDVLEILLEHTLKFTKLQDVKPINKVYKIIKNYITFANLYSKLPDGPQKSLKSKFAITCKNLTELINSDPSIKYLMNADEIRALFNINLENNLKLNIFIDSIVTRLNKEFENYANLDFIFLMIRYLTITKFDQKQLQHFLEKALTASSKNLKYSKTILDMDQIQKLVQNFSTLTEGAYVPSKDLQNAVLLHKEKKVVIIPQFICAEVLKSVNGESAKYLETVKKVVPDHEIVLVPSLPTTKADLEKFLKNNRLE